MMHMLYHCQKWLMGVLILILCFHGYSEDVRAVPGRLVELKSSKHYLTATELLMNSGGCVQ